MTRAFLVGGRCGRDHPVASRVEGGSHPSNSATFSSRIPALEEQDDRALVVLCLALKQMQSTLLLQNLRRERVLGERPGHVEGGENRAVAVHACDQVGSGGRRVRRLPGGTRRPAFARSVLSGLERAVQRTPDLGPHDEAPIAFVRAIDDGPGRVSEAGLLYQAFGGRDEAVVLSPTLPLRRGHTPT